MDRHRSIWGAQAASLQLRQLPATIARSAGQEIASRRFGKHAETGRLAACAPQNRNHPSRGLSDCAFRAISMNPARYPAVSGLCLPAPTRSPRQSPLPFVLRSRSNIPNSATAAANFKSGAAFSNFEPLSVNERSESSLVSPSGFLCLSFTVTSRRGFRIGWAGCGMILQRVDWRDARRGIGGAGGHDLIQSRHCVPGADLAGVHLIVVKIFLPQQPLSYPINRYDATRAGLNSTWIFTSFAIVIRVR